MKIAVIGSGSWATALAKLLTENGHVIGWWVRHQEIIDHLHKRHHNPNYLTSVQFNQEKLRLTCDERAAVLEADCILIATPSSYVLDFFNNIKPEDLVGKKVLSAVKGILPEYNMLLNEYLGQYYDFPLIDYFAVMGPCHAEEVAKEKLSYLTFSGIDETTTQKIALMFASENLRTVINTDINGVQYAAILKNIYAVGAGIAHGLEYGDNFQSVLIANCADEMAGFLRKSGSPRIEVGVHEYEDRKLDHKKANYAASVYLGDLLVTCYSPYSRNRTFGNMMGKGYTVQSAQLEMNMVAEGYFASKCIYSINQKVGADIPIAHAIYHILWEKLAPREGFRLIEQKLI